MRAAIQLVISIWLLLHLLVVGLAPNPDSIVFRKAESLITSYGNFLGVNTTWRFFSPNPLIQTIFYEAVAYSEDGDVTFHLEKRFPEPGVEVSSRESLNRMMSSAMMTSGRIDLIDPILKPFLCARHPKADQIFVYAVQYKLPSIDKARILGGDREDLTTKERTAITNFKCKEDS